MEETRKQLENRNERLRRAMAEAEHANQLRTDYISQLSRNIRTSLNTVTGMAAIARMNIGDQDKVLECLDKIELSGQQLLKVINEITDVSELSDHIMKLDEVSFYLEETVWQTLNEFTGQIRDKNLTVRMIIRKVTYEHLTGDLNRIRQMLGNLISNAVKYTPPLGTVTVVVEELHSFQDNISLFRFEIEDTGIGMSEEFMWKMYQPFVRAENLNIGKEQGSGLGLTIAMRLVRMMSGDITAVSSPEEGTKFTVTLHLKHAKEKELSDWYKSFPLLLIGEEWWEGEEVANMLCEKGLRADYISTAAECIDSIQRAAEAQSPYKVVVMNWEMSEMSGMDLAGQINKQMGVEAPGIIFISNAWEMSQEEEKARNFSEFVTSPVTLAKLCHAMDIICPRAVSEGIGNRKIGSLAGKRILVAEDNELNGEMIKELLQQHGVVVDVAENGSMVLDLLNAKEAEYYDCILMDIRMPVLNGYVVTRKIRESKRPDLQKIPIIAMTADAFSADIQKAKEVGMDAHMAKPFEIDELMKIFSRFIM